MHYSNVANNLANPKAIRYKLDSASAHLIVRMNMPTSLLAEIGDTR